MTWLDALLLGALEGLTEFLPVSSTGHLILLGAWLGQNDEVAKTLDVVIQLGAVVAVVVYYRARLARLARGCLRRDPASLRLLLSLAVAFLPAAIVGFALHGFIKERLFGPGPVGLALIVGGLVMTGVDAWRRKKGTAEGEEDDEELGSVTLGRAVVIGLFQCFALWPGASRSMTTIMGGQLAGLGTKAAADFSFLLAIPTLGAATAYDLAKGGSALLASPSGPLSLAVGLVASFVVAWLVIAAFVRYLKRFGLAPFGVYRIALGALVLLLGSA